jgi:hypothetical protein
MKASALIQKRETNQLTSGKRLNLGMKATESLNL